MTKRIFVIVVATLWCGIVQSGEVKWLVRGCDDLPEFLSTWSYITQEFPFLATELNKIASGSGAGTVTVNEFGTVISSTVKMTKCEVALPTEDGVVVDGLREVLTYHEWNSNGVKRMGGILTDYSLTTDPVTKSVTRIFRSAAICRSPSACVRRGIVAKETSENPDPKPIILEPSPKKPTPKN